MPPFIPDVPYKIQGIFIAVFSFIWISAFTDNYLEEVPLEGEARTEILVSRIISTSDDFRELILGEALYQ
jgi:hypothetical protein